MSSKSQKHKKTKDNSKKVLCSYHLCNKKATKKCEFCGEWFCDQHIRPKPPTIPQFDKDFLTPLEHELMKEYHAEDGHPCPPYYKIWEKNYKEINKKYINGLNKLLKTRKKDTDIEKQEERHWFNLDFLFSLGYLILFSMLTFILYIKEPYYSNYHLLFIKPWAIFIDISIYLTIKELVYIIRYMYAWFRHSDYITRFIVTSVIVSIISLIIYFDIGFGSFLSTLFNIEYTRFIPFVF